jgi:MerR family transcriptional regulator, redox-sensitive transcriptional activator SoxR
MKNPFAQWQELTVGQLSKRSGVAVSALHFYETKGLIKSTRNSGNQRRYGREVLRRVSLIKVAQGLGVSLTEIKKCLDQLPKGKKPSTADWKIASKQWKKHLEDRIFKLTKLKNQLNSCIGCGCLSLRECPLRNPFDILRAKGSGPRLLTQDEE